MWMFTCVKENAFHRPHNSWLTEEVVHHVALAIVAGSRQAGSYSGPEVPSGEVWRNRLRRGTNDGEKPGLGIRRPFLVLPVVAFAWHKLTATFDSCVRFLAGVIILCDAGHRAA